MKIFYVYKHIRLDTGEVFYVGKGHKQRLISTDKRNRVWHNIVNKHGFKAEIIEDNLSDKDAFVTEIKWITFYKSIGLAKANMTLGGEGTVGYKHTDECKKLMSAKRKGSKLSPEHKTKISLFQRGIKRTKQFNDRVAIGKGTMPFLVFKAIKIKYGQYIKGELLGKYINQHQAERDFDVPGSNINMCLKKIRKQSKGFIFEYEGAS